MKTFPVFFIIPIILFLTGSTPNISGAGTCQQEIGGMVVLTNGDNCGLKKYEKNQKWIPYSQQQDDYHQDTTIDPLTNIINAVANEKNIDPALIRAMIEVESAGNSQAVSARGAVGLMQIMPATASELNIDPYNPIENIRGGVNYLTSLLRQFGQIQLALAAYNAGPGAVQRYGGIPPYPETKKYVNRVLNHWKTLTKNQT